MTTRRNTRDLADALMQSEVPDSLIDEAAIMLRHQADRIEALLGVRKVAMELSGAMAEGKSHETVYASLLGLIAALAHASLYDDGPVPPPERT